jgi:hypothetical protein
VSLENLLEPYIIASSRGIATFFWVTELGQVKVFDARCRDRSSKSRLRKAFSATDRNSAYV